MRILHILGHDDIPGGDIRFLDLAGAFASLPDIEQKAIIRHDRTLESVLESRTIAFETSKFGGLFDLQTTSEVNDIIGAFNPHLIQSYGPEAAAFFPKEFSKCPHVVLWNGDFERRVFESCTAVIVPDYGSYEDGMRIKEGSENIYHLPPLTAPNADPEPLQRHEHETPDDAFIIGTIGNLSDPARLVPVLDGLKEVPGMHFWIAGSGPAEQEIKNRIQTFGLQDRVKLIGWQSSRAAFLKAIDLCIVPTGISGVSYLSLESWAMGTPVLSGNQVHTPVIHGENGWIVSSNDKTGWRESLKLLMDDNALRARMNAAGKETYNSTYLPDIITKFYFQLYRKVFEEFQGATL